MSEVHCTCRDNIFQVVYVLYMCLVHLSFVIVDNRTMNSSRFEDLTCKEMFPCLFLKDKLFFIVEVSLIVADLHFYFALNVFQIKLRATSALDVVPVWHFFD